MFLCIVHLYEQVYVYVDFKNSAGGSVYKLETIFKKKMGPSKLVDLLLL